MDDSGSYHASTRGIVFDVLRFSLHDGPGIRTTVFLKGCPLSCLWCHNPESQSFRLQLSFNAENCMNCLDCADICPTGALGVFDGRLAVLHDLCTGCGECVDECTSNALSVIGREVTAEEILDEVERDLPYFERSGGGLTISGGEPLSQPRFALAVLAAAKDRGIHTCLDTSGAVHPRRLQDAIPLTDLFLFDYKATAPGRHQMLTGVSNELILENFGYLYEKGARIILRCPLVPGINDTAFHLAGIAKMAADFPDLEGVHVMPYHNLGRAKAAAIGADNPLGDLASADEATKREWLDQLHALGCTRCEIG